MTARVDTKNTKPKLQDLIAGIELEYVAHSGITEYDGAIHLIDPWAPIVGTGNLVRTSAGLINQADDGDGRVAIRCTGGVLRKTFDVRGGSSADFGAAVIWRRNNTTGASGALLDFGDDSGSTAARMTVYANANTSVQAVWVNSIAGNNVGTDTFAPGTTWHVTMLYLVGSTLWIQTDDRAPVSSATSGTLIGTRMSVGAAFQSNAYLLAADKVSIRSVAVRRGTAWSTLERATLYRYLNDNRAFWGA